MKRFKSKPSYIILVAAVVFVAGFIILGRFTGKIQTVGNRGDFNIETEFSRLKTAGPNLFNSFLSSADDIIKRGGISGGEEIVRKAFSRLQLDLVECHHLMHVLGHEAVDYYEQDADKIARHVSAFCEHGYQHGAEAEMYGFSKQGGSYEPLRKFCEAVRNYNAGELCYKGVGHSALSETLDVQRAIQICEKIVPDTQKSDREYCYQGIFNDLTNKVSGIDSDTGMTLSGPPLMKLPSTPIDYCASLKEPYRHSCIFELGGHMHTVANGNHTGALLECLKGDHDKALVEECIRAVSAIIAQKFFVQTKDTGTVTVTKNKLVDSWGTVYRRAYILGVAGELAEAERWGAQTNLTEFCHGFGDPEDETYCLQFDRR